MRQFFVVSVYICAVFHPAIPGVHYMILILKEATSRVKHDSFLLQQRIYISTIAEDGK